MPTPAEWLDEEYRDRLRRFAGSEGGDWLEEWLSQPHTHLWWTEAQTGFTHCAHCPAVKDD